MRTPRPLLSVFDGNSQERFIEPFHGLLRRLGVEIRFEHRVERLAIREGRIAAFVLRNGDRIGSPDDCFVLASPLETTRGFVDGHILRLDPDRTAPGRAKLGDLKHLRRRRWPRSICRSAAGSIFRVSP